MKIGEEWDGNPTELIEEYRHQPKLTEKPGKATRASFTQPLINENILWKSNHYGPLSPKTLAALNRLSNPKPEKHRKSRAIPGAQYLIHQINQC